MTGNINIVRCPVCEQGFERQEYRIHEQFAHAKYYELQAELAEARVWSKAWKASARSHRNRMHQAIDMTARHNAPWIKMYAQKEADNARLRATLEQCIDGLEYAEKGNLNLIDLELIPERYYEEAERATEKIRDISKRARDALNVD